MVTDGRPGKTMKRGGSGVPWASGHRTLPGSQTQTTEDYPAGQAGMLEPISTGSQRKWLLNCGQIHLADGGALPAVPARELHPTGGLGDAGSNWLTRHWLAHCLQLVCPEGRPDHG